MKWDLKSCAGHILCVQEAEPELLDNMRSVPNEAASSILDPRGDGGNKPQRRDNKFVGVRGTEPGSSLMICGRQSLVVGIRLNLFRRRVDGTYRASGRKGKSTKIAVSKVMVATLKMRYFKICGSGEDGSDCKDEITIVNAHLHCMTAKGDVSNGSRSQKEWWDELAQVIVEFGARFLCGDFNMGLFSVIPELRARGFQINLAAWYCWQQNLESHVRADSCGMFHIGPCQGIRICLCPSLCGIDVDPRPDKCSMVMETIVNSEGKQTQQPHSVPTYDFVGQGYPLTSYRPKEPDNKKHIPQMDFHSCPLSPLNRGGGECRKRNR